MSNVAGLPPVQLGRWPLYSILVQFPVACFVGALLTDVQYLRSQLYLWETFSVWLLAAGCVFAGIAGIAGSVIFIGHRSVRAAPLAWPYALTSLAAALLAIVNTFVHSRDGYTAVVPTGLTLSSIVVLLMVVATAFGWYSFHGSTSIGEAK
jgi:uncharacterized membrane protein